jgi:hypothetical protein
MKDLAVLTSAPTRTPRHLVRQRLRLAGAKVREVEQVARALAVVDRHVKIPFATAQRAVKDPAHITEGKARRHERADHAVAKLGRHHGSPPSSIHHFIDRLTPRGTVDAIRLLFKHTFYAIERSLNFRA